MNKLELFSKLREDLIDAPKEVKKSFNNIIEYFAKGKGKMDDDDEPDTLSECKDLIKGIDKDVDAFLNKRNLKVTTEEDKEFSKVNSTTNGAKQIAKANDKMGTVAYLMELKDGSQVLAMDSNGYKLIIHK